MRVELRPDLEEQVARMVRPAVERLTTAVARQAQATAPAARIWVTVDDERVRPSHAAADQQAIPANLRFKLRKQRYGRSGRSARRGAVTGRYVLAPSGFDLARVPRDEDLPADQRLRCRCIAVEVPDLISRQVRTVPAVVEGRRTRGRVTITFNRLVESHTGTSRDAPWPFLTRALQTVAARTRTARA